MNMFFRRSINEYRRQIGLKESFAIQTERLRDTLESIEWTDCEEPPTNRRALRRRASLLMLFPLAEIAWADGRVSRRESDAIVRIADAYGLSGDETGMREMLENLTARPIHETVERRWRNFQNLLEKLSDFDRENVAYCLTVQARFVAEQTSDNLLAFLRGERVSESEKESLRLVAERLDNALAAANLNEERRNAVFAAEKAANETREEAAPAALTADDYYFGDAEVEAALEEYGKLVPLVPLVKTAWAEGRVTKRERHLVFEAAARMGVKPGTTAHDRLAEWLELHPTDEFYEHSLDILRERWQRLDADEKNQRRYDLLHDCARIAEASGGSKDFAAGGGKICDDEILAVKHIARKLNGASATVN